MDKKPYSILKKSRMIVGLLLVVLTGIFIYQNYLRARDEVFQEKLNQLEEVAIGFEAELSVVIEQVLRIENEQSLIPREKIHDINKIIQPLAQQLSEKDILCGTGYFSQDLRNVVALSPLHKKDNLLYYFLGTACPNSEFYQPGQEHLRYITSAKRNILALVGKAYYYQGKKVGIFWVYSYISNYYSLLLKKLVNVLSFSLLFIIIAIAGFCYLGNRFKNGLERLGIELDRFNNGSSDDRIKQVLFNDFPVEFHPILNQYTGMANRLQELLTELAISERLAAIGDIVPIMAHEIRNPLMVIKGTAQLGLISGDWKKQKQLYSQIDQNCDLIEKFLVETLKLSSNQADELEKIDLSSVLHGLLVLIIPLMKKKGIIFKKQIAQKLPLIRGNSTALSQVLINLLKNAIDATDAGGTITLKIYPQAYSLRIEVTDTGYGIPEEIQDQLFKKFFTTKGPNGTGIGLALVQKIISKHQGKIWFKSVKKKGSTFYIELPTLKT